MSLDTATHRVLTGIIEAVNHGQYSTARFYAELLETDRERIECIRLLTTALAMIPKPRFVERN